jgi:ferredoxin
MPALEEEIEEATAEHIAINNSWGPKRILSEGGRVTGVEFMRCLSVFNEEGRFCPSYDENDTMVAAADTVLLSIGQSISWGGLLEGSKVTLKPNGTAVADAFTLQTEEPDVFVGGDAFAGPRFAIDAIAQGKEAAISIHRFVQKGQDLLIGRDRHDYIALDKDSVVIEGYDNTPRQRAVDLAKDKGTVPMSSSAFRDERGTFTEEQMKRETERCLGCGATVRDEFLCVGCGQCTTKCKFDAITLVRKYNGKGVAWEDVKLPVITTVLKRKGRIAAKNLKDALTNKETRE